MASPQKRVAEEVAEEAPCKRSRLSESEAASTCSRLANVLLQNPLVARTLMESLLKNSIALSPSKRGEREEKLATEVVDVVNTLSSWKTVEVEQLKSLGAELRAEWAALDKGLQQAEADATAAHAHFMDLAFVAADDSSAADVAEAAVKAKLMENRTEDKAFDLLAKEKDKLEQTLEDLRALRDGDCHKSKVNKVAKSIAAVGAAHRFDATMMDMLPSCLQKPMANRGDFDIMCIESVQQEMQVKLDELCRRVEAAAQAKDGAAQELEDLRTAAAQAAEVHRASRAKADVAKAAETEARQRTTEAEAKVEAVRVKIMEAEVELEAAIAANDAFNASAVADLESLVVGHAGA